MARTHKANRPRVTKPSRIEITTEADAAAYIEQLLTEMSPEDAALVREIFAAADQVTVASLVRAYYADMDRSERTPRAILYLHLGMVCGIAISALKRSAH